MKRALLFGAVLLAISFSLYKSQQVESLPLASDTQNKITESKSFFLGARTTTPTNSKTVTLEAKVDEGCGELKSKLDAIDFNLEVTEWVEFLNPAIIQNCHSTTYANRLSSLQKECFTEFNEMNCAQEAVFLRALLRTNGIEAAEDRELLADLILKEFANGSPNFNKLAEHADKLLDLDPDQPTFQKLWAASKVIAKIDGGNSAMDLADEVNKRISDEVWNDSDMQGIKLAMHTGFQPSNVEEFARGYLSQKSDPRMHEILGWALWRQNKYAEAISQLQEAIRLSPQDQWLKDQLKLLNSKNVDAESYKARISLGFQLQDLYQ